ncbi:MAG TPA: cytochrome c oxidase subunit II [Terriglobales bacterium]|nr:cytochrome c oxidase subunit II [Terriglobales bacterium]
MPRHDGRLTGRWLPGLTALLASGCGGPSSVLDPRGPGAAQIASLTWVLIGVAGGLYVVVLAALVIAVRRRGASPTGSERWGRAGVVAGGIVLPLLVLPVLVTVSVRTLAAVTRPASAALVVEVVGQQYWWDLRYRTPDGRDLAVAANELHLPAGRRVELHLRSVDVIHSFWVPALQGKLDLVPGKTNVTWVHAEAPGIHPGQCAEYCGIQHALMRLLVVVERAEDFDAWLLSQREPARPPADSGRAQDLFLLHCAHCHTVRGTAAFFGHTGPDLTHLMSRRTLAAGTLANVKGNLAGWLADPQHHKPGSRMPRITLPPDDFHAVLDYLTSLR